MTKNHKMIFIALLTAQAIVLGIIEGMLPVPFIAPGAKLGLANIISVIALYTLSFTEAMTIVFLRAILTALLTGSISSLPYSFLGGILSLLSMYLVLRVFKHRVSTIGVSVIGSVFHNIGQVLVAAAVIQSFNIVMCLPLLLITGVGTGMFVGFASGFLLRHIERLSFVEKLNFRR